MQETNVWFRSRSQSSAVKRTDKLGFPAGRGYLPEAEHHRTLASLCQKNWQRHMCVNNLLRQLHSIYGSVITIDLAET